MPSHGITGVGAADVGPASAMATSVYDRERTLTREVTDRVEHGVPGVEVLAVELTGPERFCVYIDHAKGVDHDIEYVGDRPRWYYLTIESIDVDWSVIVDEPIYGETHK